MRGTLIAVVSTIYLMGSSAQAQCDSCGTGSGWIKIVRIPSAGGIPGAGTPQPLFCVSDTTDFAIDLNSYSWSTDNWVIHIYDCASGAGSPTHHIGKVTISGDPSGITSLAVLVAGAGQVWDDRVTEPLLRGCIDFGGLEISDSDVLAKTRCSIAISGDLTQVDTATPGLHANSFVRIQAEGRDGGSGTWIGGNLAGDIVAEGSAVPFGPSLDAIGQVRAWNSIAGKIEAKAYNIAAVRVVGDPGSTPAPQGISGDILAITGLPDSSGGIIRSIYSAGPIGNGLTGESRMKITAGNGIGQIRTIQEGSPAVLLAREVDAVITANKVMADDPEGFIYVSPNVDGVLQLLETGGDLHGVVRAGNIGPYAGGGRTGLFVRGVCHAPITVDLTVVGASIVAQTFIEDIQIGWCAQGSIVATGDGEEVEGEIPSVTIGSAGLPDTGGYAVTFPRPGLVANPTYSRPFPTTIENWFEADSPMDSVVHAEHSIGEADVIGLIGLDANKYPPRHRGAAHHTTEGGLPGLWRGVVRSVRRRGSRFRTDRPRGHRVCSSDGRRLAQGVDTCRRAKRHVRGHPRPRGARSEHDLHRGDFGKRERDRAS